jgi:hypothetical protein
MAINKQNTVLSSMAYVDVTVEAYQRKCFVFSFDINLFSYF